MSLARAVYQDLDIYLLDDCLSAVDAHVGRSIFEKCLTGALKNKTRVLITHQLQFVGYADLVIVLKDGRITEMGSYEELMTAKGEFSNLISTHVTSAESHEGDEEETTETVSSSSKSESKKDASKAASSGKLMTSEEREIGQVDARVWKAYAVAIGGVWVAGLVFLGYFLDTGSRYSLCTVCFMLIFFSESALIIGSVIGLNILPENLLFIWGFTQDLAY